MTEKKYKRYKLVERKGENGCTEPVPLVFRKVTVDWGLTKFVYALSSFDAYAYAAFPRQDVSGVLSQYTRRAAIETPGGNHIPSAGLDVVDRGEAARAVPNLISFADGKFVDDDDHGAAIEFGWVVVSPDLAEPVQKSQLVLVSVPTYMESLDLEITTGWLDENGAEVVLRNPPDNAAVNSRYCGVNCDVVTVPLPKDFEAFDRIVVQGAARPGPQIFADPIYESKIVVSACERAEILIPGTRLWRSTSVVLGGQPADRIVVLPNMQGLIATFEQVRPPSTIAPDSPSRFAEGLSDLLAEGLRVQEAELTVWTSEGMARLENGDVVMIVPESGRCNAAPPDDASLTIFTGEEAVPPR